jgi:hypothetical protein
MKSLWRTFSLPKPITLLLEALAFAVAVASKCPKASPLGLSDPYKERGFGPRGMPSSLSHNFQWVKEQ